MTLKQSQWDCQELVVRRLPITYLYIIKIYLDHHCCLWCHIESSPHVSVVRTDNSLESDLERFQMGGSNLKNAKSFSNVYGDKETLLSRAFDSGKIKERAINTYHFLLLLLGLSSRTAHQSQHLLTLLEDACHELDVKHVLQLQKL